MKVPKAYNFDPYPQPEVWIGLYVIVTLTCELKKEISKINIIHYRSSPDIDCIMKLLSLLLQSKDGGSPRNCPYHSSGVIRTL